MERVASVTPSSLENADFVEAARRGDLTTVRRMLASGRVHMDAVLQPTGETAFSAALAAHRRPVYEYLIAQGAWLGGPCRRPDGVYSPMLLAVTWRDAALVKELAERGKGLDDSAASFGPCPLVEAVRLGAIDVCDILLDHGAPIRLRHVPRHLWYRQYRQGESIADSVRVAWLVLALACWYRHVAMVRHLLTTRHVLRDPDGDSVPAVVVLCVAAETGQRAILRELVSSGYERVLANPSWCESRDCYPIKSSIVHDDVETLQLMLQWTPRATLDYGAEVRTVSLLELAAACRAYDSAALLITERLTRPRHVDAALHKAVSNADAEMTELLLRTTQSLTVEAFRTCMETVLSMWWYPQITALLLSHCCEQPWLTTEELDRLLFYACTCNTGVPTVSLLVAYGAHVAACPLDGAGDALTRAARHEEGAALVLFLLDHGAPALVHDSARGRDTPLALLRGHEQRCGPDPQRTEAIQRLVAVGPVTHTSHKTTLI